MSRSRRMTPLGINLLTLARSVPCSRCHRASGEDCDPRTLGRFPWHRARIESAIQAQAPPQDDD